MLSSANAGLLPETAEGVVFGLALFYGGIVQVFAGLWEFAKGNTFGSTAFCSYGAFWMSFWYLVVHVDLSEAGADAKTGVGFFLLGWTIFTVYMTVAALRTTSALFGVFVLLSLTFVCLTAGGPRCRRRPGDDRRLARPADRVRRLVLRFGGSAQRDVEAHRPAGRPASLSGSCRAGRAVRRRGHPAPGGPSRPPLRRATVPTSRAKAATVKKVGVGMRPVSILRRVSAEIPAAFATSTMLRSPRACRSRRPSRTPRSRSDGVKGTRTMCVIVIPV